MPSALRAQVALVGLLAVLLIPIGTSSLRGLTHVLTCNQEAAADFSVNAGGDTPATATSSAIITRRDANDGTTNATGAVTVNELCGGLTLDLAVGTPRENRVPVTLIITNNSDYGWRGSVQMQLDNTTLPITIGRIDAGAVAKNTFVIRVDPDRRYALKGSLLIGP